MQNLKRKISKIKAKLLINQQFLSNFNENNRLEPKKRLFLKVNKRHLRADVLSLLSSALRPRLLSAQGSTIGRNRLCYFYHYFIRNRGKCLSNLPKIVALSTIPIILGGCQTLQAIPVSAASLTLSIPSDALKLDINPAGGTVFKKTDASSIDISTNALAGYTLSIKSKTNNKLTSGSNDILSISENISEEEYQNNAKYDNTWGFQPSKFNGVDNHDFLPTPGSENSIIEITSSKNEDKTTYNFVIGAKINAMQPVGEYTNTLVILATANAIPYSIQYELNDGSAELAANPQTGTSTSETIKLDPAVPTRSNYKFLGWCDAYTNDKNCSGNIYQPGEDYTLKDEINNVAFYAIWEEDMATLQNFDCDKLLADQTVTLKDVRDDNTYTVSKLKDGKCWMTQNLKIAGQTLTPETSDVTAPLELPESNIANFQTYYYYKDINENQNPVYVDNIYGGYYNWYTAIENNLDSAGSICPKEWRLPTADEFTTLATAYNNSASALASAPANFKYNGYIWIGASTLNGIKEQGVSGNYFSSTDKDCCDVAQRLLMTMSSNAAAVKGFDGQLCDGRYAMGIRCVSRSEGENYTGEDKKNPSRCYSACAAC